MSWMFSDFWKKEEVTKEEERSSKKKGEEEELTRGKAFVSLNTPHAQRSLK